MCRINATGGRCNLPTFAAGGQPLIAPAIHRIPRSPAFASPARPSRRAAAAVTIHIAVARPGTIFQPFAAGGQPLAAPAIPRTTGSLCFTSPARRSRRAAAAMTIRIAVAQPGTVFSDLLPPEANLSLVLRFPELLARSVHVTCPPEPPRSGGGVFYDIY
ncbi:hypothetical protein C8R43DRAFT_1138486 [Mycena crocata]|nr:hypothetical protein C8R43DRAFT_1138486 [Mycena crocata]